MRLRPLVSLAVVALVAIVLGAPAWAAPRPTSTASPKPSAPSVTHPDSTPVDTTVAINFPGPDSTLVPNLREGGFVLLFRHCATDWTQRDADGENFEDRSAQRNLSKVGEEQAAGIGAAFRKLEIPVLAVLTSPMWRCRDTGQLAFGQEQPMVELFRRGAEYRAARLMLLGSELEAGQNLVLVTHQDLMVPIIEGLRRDYVKEGECLVIRPLGEATFDVVAKVTLEDWAKLAGLPAPPKIPAPPR
ncbi:MAG: histidine phosphatase family protein [Candidatus Eiseniibacteriota bacterium]